MLSLQKHLSKDREEIKQNLAETVISLQGLKAGFDKNKILLTIFIRTPTQCAHVLLPLSTVSVVPAVYFFLRSLKIKSEGLKKE